MLQTANMSGDKTAFTGAWSLAVCAQQVPCKAQRINESSPHLVYFATFVNGGQTKLACNCRQPPRLKERLQRTRVAPTPGAALGNTQRVNMQSLRQAARLALRTAQGSRGMATKTAEETWTNYFPKPKAESPEQTAKHVRKEMIGFLLLGPIGAGLMIYDFIVGLEEHSDEVIPPYPWCAAAAVHAPAPLHAVFLFVSTSNGVSHAWHA